jgi:aspartate racemase
MDKRRARCIGLIGGLGPGATVHYYQGLLRAHSHLMTPDLVIIHADVNRVLSLIGQGDTLSLALYLAGLIKRLENAGAEITAQDLRPA